MLNYESITSTEFVVERYQFVKDYIERITTNKSFFDITGQTSLFEFEGMELRENEEEIVSGFVSDGDETAYVVFIKGYKQTDGDFYISSKIEYNNSETYSSYEVFNKSELMIKGKFTYSKFINIDERKQKITCTETVKNFFDNSGELKYRLENNILYAVEHEERSYKIAKKEFNRKKIK